MSLQVDPWLFLQSGCFLLLFYFLLQGLRLERWRMKYSRLLPTKPFRPLNVLGNMSDVPLSDEARNQLSFNVFILQVIHAYKQFFSNEKLFCFWISYVPFIVGYKAEVVEEMIGNTNFMDKSWNYRFIHPWLNTGLATSGGAKWKSRRKLLTSSFHMDILRDFMPVINEKANILVTRMKEETNREFTDIVLPITLCSLDIICETTLGVNVRAQENYDNQYLESLGRVSVILYERTLNVAKWFDFIFYRTELGRELKRHIKILHDFTDSVIREKKAKMLSGTVETSSKKRKALMDLLLEQHLHNKALSEEDIREEVDTFSFAGQDTTSMAMTWALYLIGLYQNAQDKIHEELDSIFGNDLERPATIDDINDMKYLECVIKESLRIYPSVPMIGRQAKEDSVICGMRVPKGAIIMPVFYMLHRDETVFPDPEKFDPDRFLPENCQGRSPFAYAPFAAGPRNCIGQKFAMLEEKVVLSTFLRHFAIKSLDPRDQQVPTPELVLRPSKAVRIQIRERRAS